MDENCRKYYYARNKFNRKDLENVKKIESNIEWNTIFDSVIPINDIDYGNEMFLMIGEENGQVLRAFNNRGNRLYSDIKNLISIKFIPDIGLFLVCGLDGKIASSYDGINWNLYDDIFLPDRPNMFNIEYDGDNIIIVGQFGYITTSRDGDSWDKILMKYTNQLNAITYGNGLYVTVGHGIIYTSKNLNKWVLRRPYNKNILTGVAYGNGIYVAVGQFGTILISKNGINWTTLVSDKCLSHIRDIKFKNGLFLAVTDDELLYSKNGLLWYRMKLKYEHGFISSVNVFTGIDGIDFVTIIGSRYINDSANDMYYIITTDINNLITL